MITLRLHLIEGLDQLIEIHALFRVEVVELALEERDGDLVGGRMHGEGQLQQMVLHCGNVVIHPRVEEGQHYLLFDEGQSLHLRLWLPANRVIPHCLCALEPADLLAHDAEHHLHALILAPRPLLTHPIAQLLVPVADDLEHQLDTLGVLKDLLLDHYLQEVPAQYLDAPLHVGTCVLLQVETLHLLSTLVSHQFRLPTDVIFHVENHSFREQ